MGISPFLDPVTNNAANGTFNKFCVPRYNDGNKKIPNLNMHGLVGGTSLSNHPKIITMHHANFFSRLESPVLVVCDCTIC